MPTDQEIELKEATERVGTTLRDKWHLERLIAVGGMGAVYEARHRNGMRGAVKVLDRALSRTSDARERFLREGLLANEVSHIGAVRVLDDDETEDGSAYLVMEMLHGKTLDRIASDRGGTIAADELARYAAQVLDTLVAAHARGIVHRDIKPENLLLTTDGIVKILDFGIARMDGFQESARLTQAGETLGTPAFMSPEQASGHHEDVDGRSDIYSLGATIFTLATGALVHNDATTVPELLVQVITTPARSVKLAGPVPDALAAVIDKALAFSPTARFDDALAMRTTLEAAYREMTGQPIPPTPTPAQTSSPAIDITTTAATVLRARFMTTMARPRTRWALALGAPIVMLAVGALVVGTGARSQAAVATVTSVPIVVRNAPVVNQEPQPSDETLPVATAASSSTAITPPKANPAASRLSRRNSLYDRRY